MRWTAQEAFFNEARAYEFIERRVWPDGPVCPRCNDNSRVGKLQGGTTRIGVYKCYRCRKPFTIKIGTVLESSHVPMNVWLQAICLVCLGQREISANHLAHALGTSLRTACFMRARIRRAWEGEAGDGLVAIDDPHHLGSPPEALAFREQEKPNTPLDHTPRRSSAVPTTAWPRRVGGPIRYAHHRGPLTWPGHSGARSGNTPDQEPS